MKENPGIKIKVLKQNAEDISFIKQKDEEFLSEVKSDLWFPLILINIACPNFTKTTNVLTNNQMCWHVQIYWHFFGLLKKQHIWTWTVFAELSRKINDESDCLFRFLHKSSKMYSLIDAELILTPAGCTGWRRPRRHCPCSLRKCSSVFRYPFPGYGCRSRAVPGKTEGNCKIKLGHLGVRHFDIKGAASRSVANKGTARSRRKKSSKIVYP